MAAMNFQHWSRCGLARWLRHGIGIACLCAAPLAYAGHAILLPEGPVTLVRGTSVFTIDAPLAVEPGDLFSTDAHASAQIEDANGTIVALGPQTRISIDAAPRGVNADTLDALSLLSGWIKVERGGADSSGQLKIDTAALRVGMPHGVAVIHASGDAASLFIETGGILLTLPDSADAPRSLNAEHYVQRENGKPLEAQARPAPAFVTGLPLAFRDPLASITARMPTQPLAPTHGRVAAYSDIAEWLVSPLTVRRTFVTRFRSLARTETFRRQVRQNLRDLPEWRTVLCPPPSAPPRRPGIPKTSEVDS
jgi:hypothetical protein